MNAAFEQAELEATEIGALLKSGEITVDLAIDKALWDGRVHVRRNAALTIQAAGGVDSTKVVQLTVAAKDADPVVREHCVGVLGVVEAEASVLLPALLHALSDMDDRVADVALRSLEQVVKRQIPDAIGMLVEALASNRPVVQRTVHDVLVRGATAALPHLVACLSHRDAMVRKGCRAALRDIGPPAGATLIEAMADQRQTEPAATVLLTFDSLQPDHVQALTALASSANPLISIAARRVLKTVKAADSTPPAPDTVDIEGFYDKLLDHETLASAAASAAPETILKTLADGRPAARANGVGLVTALGKKGIDAEGATEALSPLLKDAHPAVRRRLAGAFVALGGGPAVRCLVDLAGDGDDKASAKAKAALLAIAPKNVAELLASVRNRQPDHSRLAVLEALVAAGKKAAPGLTVAIRASDRPLIRRIAARALGGMRADGAQGADVLVGALRDEDDFVRKISAWALGRIGVTDAAVFDALSHATRDSVFAVRREASRSIEKLRGKAEVPKVLEERQLPMAGMASEALPEAKITKESKTLDAPTLEAMLFDGRPMVRRNAAAALGALGAKANAAVSSLTLCLKDAEEDVRVAAARSLGQLAQAPELAVPALAKALVGATPDQEQVVLAAIDAYGKAAVAPMMATLEGRPHEVTQGLGKVARRNAKTFVKPLIAAMTSDEGSVVARENAVDVVGTLGPEGASAEDALLDALEDNAVLFRVKVLRALGKTAKPTVALTERLQALRAADGRHSVDNAVVDAIRMLRSRAREG